MKRLLTLILAVTLAAASLTACGKKDNTKKIVVGASSTPHAEILEQIKSTVEKSGYELEIVVYDDYVLPNKGLSDGTLDANYFQHTPYLDSYNKSNDTDLISAGSVHYEPFGLYGKGVSKISDAKKGAKIIIPADDSNETRALLLLQQEGIIKLPDNSNAKDGVTVLDIVDNGGFEITAVQADTVPAQLKNADDGTLAVINGNYALAAGYDIKTALAIENAEGDAAKTYANIIAVRKGEEKSSKINVLMEALLTEDVKEFINKKYNGAVLPIF